ncbi:MAG: DUF1127 domain-containing protein [Thalassovita sp.]|mgnify:CR=1 FL=1
MAAYSNTPHQAGVLTSPVSTSARIVAQGFEALARWNDARTTRKVLSRLNDAELEDIGLCRADLDYIAAKI